MADKAENTLTSKTTPVGADYIRIIDSQDTNKSKKALASSLPVSTATAASIALKLAIANDLSDLHSAATARTNLGLDATATAACLTVANNLSDGVPETMRTNLGLGDASVKNTGTTAGTLAAADDSRIVNAVQTSRTVNGHALSEDVTVTATDVGLGSVDNTADTEKPVSTAQQTALDLKQDITDALTVVTSGESIVIDFTKSSQSLTVAHAATITTSNLEAVRNVRVFIVGDSVNRAITFPVGWHWYGGTMPAIIQAGIRAELRLTSLGTTDDTVRAYYTTTW